MSLIKKQKWCYIYQMKKKSIHFEEMLNEIRISIEWVNQVLDSPDKVEVKDDGTVHYLKKITQYNHRWLRVVVNETITPNKLVTVFFDRRLRRINHENKS